MYYDIEFLKQYDPSTTVIQLIDLLKESEKLEKRKHKNEYDEVKIKYNDVYLKSFDKKHIFGPRLEVYHIQRIVKQEFKERGNIIYHVEGQKVSITKNDIHLYAMKENYGSFTHDELKAMTPITKDEYDSFVNEHNSLKNKLVHLLNKK